MNMINLGKNLIENKLYQIIDINPSKDGGISLTQLHIS